MKTIIVTLFALFSTCAVNAQTYTLNQLVGTKWRMLLPKELEKNPYFTIIDMDEYTKEEIKGTMKRIRKADGELRRESHVVRKYYLSDVKPTSFDHSKVGKVTKGSYLVIYYGKYGNGEEIMQYYKILSLTNDSLKLFHKADFKRKETRNVWIDYVRVKD